MHGKELYCEKQLLLSFNMVLEASLQTMVRWQKTSYGTVWADLIAEAEDSGFLHPDGYNGQRFTESWRPNGYSCYDHNPMAWFAQFSAAIAHEEFKLSSLKSRMKLNQMMQRMPDPQ